MTGAKIKTEHVANFPPLPSPVAMLDKMSEKRIKGYENLGYSISKHTELL